MLAGMSAIKKRKMFACLVVPHLSSEQHGSVIVLWMPLAQCVEELLPRAEVPQSHTSIPGDLWSNILIFHHQHLHDHHVHRVLYARMLIKLGSNGHEGENVVLWRRKHLQCLHREQFTLQLNHAGCPL